MPTTVDPLARAEELKKQLQKSQREPQADTTEVTKLEQQVKDLTADNKGLDRDLKQAQNHEQNERNRANTLERELEKVVKPALAEASRQLTEVEDRRKSAIRNAETFAQQLQEAKDKLAKLEERERDRKRSLCTLASLVGACLSYFPATMAVAKSRLETMINAAQAAIDTDVAKAEGQLHTFMLEMVQTIKDMGTGMASKDQEIGRLNAEVNGFKAREKAVSDGEMALQSSGTAMQQLCQRLVGLADRLEAAEQTAFTNQAKALQGRLVSGKDLGLALNDLADWAERLRAAVEQQLAARAAALLARTDALAARERRVTDFQQRAGELADELSQRILHLPTGVLEEPFRTRLAQVREQLDQPNQLGEALRNLAGLADDVARAGVPRPAADDGSTWRIKKYTVLGWGIGLFGIGAVFTALLIWLIGLSVSSSSNTSTVPYQSIFKNQK